MTTKVVAFTFHRVVFSSKTATLLFFYLPNLWICEVDLKSCISRSRSMGSLSSLATWLNFVYELSGCGLESSCSDLNFRHRECLEQGFASHAGNYRVLIHSEKRTCHDKNIQIWSSSFFSKSAEFNEDRKYTIEISETTFGFWVNGVWTCCRNFSQLCQEYMWSAANVLVKIPKSSYVNKKDVFSSNLSQFNRKLRWKCCRADFSSIWDPWTRSVSKGVLKQEPSGIQVTTFLEGNNFRNF